MALNVRARAISNNNKISVARAGYREILRFGLALAVAALAGGALAQRAPDAGTILRDQPKPPAAPQAPAKPPVLDKPAAEPADAGPRILVKSVAIRGNTLISEAELLEQVRDLVGTERTLGQLQRAALVIAGYYSQKGYLAAVIVPPQDIKDGAVEFRVTEGILGSLDVERKGERVDAARVRRFIDGRVAAGAPLDLGALGEALTIVNELPGVKATASLVRGKNEREIDLNVTAADQPLVTWNLGASNEGSRGTGVYQLTAGAALNNPTGNFDSLSLLANRTEGSTFVRADYGLALGDRGLRVGANASALRYRLVQADFQALDSRGEAETLGVAALYPLARRVDFNLSVAGGFDYKWLLDRTVAGETGNRRVRVANLGLGGYTLSEAGVLSFGASVVSGNVDQRNENALAGDQASRRTQGGFLKLAYNAGVLRPLGDLWSLTGTLRGQVAAKNLDSSERFSLGGPGGVRGYPVAEATGDEGWVASLSLSRRLGESLSLGGFLDAGGIRIDHSPPAGLTRRNRYSLGSAGLTASWQPAAQTTLNFTLAAPVGNNPGAQENGNNNDGSRRRARAWIALRALF